MKTETIFAFVRFAINDKATVFDSSDELDWEVLYEFAKKQTIVGVMFAGVEKLPKEQRPPKKILMNWFMLVERIRKRNDRLNEAVVEVTSQFERDGFPNCVLKGQGNALMYPDPSLRTSGDIDIWPLAERKDIFKYVRQVFPDTEMLYHHLEYPIIKDVMTEVHFFPMFLNNPLYNRRFQKWVKSQAKQQCENRAELPQGTFCKPTDDFNAVYQLAHVRHHFFDEGIGMRQLLDYYYLLKSETVVAKHEDLQRLLKDMRLLDFAGVVMYAMKEVFGLEETYWLTQPREKIGKMLVEEILMTGNFGHQDSRFGNLKKNSRAARMFSLLKKNMRFWWYFPGEVVFSFLFRMWQPLWRCWANMNYSR